MKERRKPADRNYSTTETSSGTSANGRRDLQQEGGVCDETWQGDNEEVKSQFTRGITASRSATVWNSDMARKQGEKTENEGSSGMKNRRSGGERGEKTGGY
jgi:hypothetical protein